MPSNNAHLRLAMPLLMLLVLRGAAGAQTISFTFDDGFDPRQMQEAAALNGQILDALRTQSVTAMLFPAGRRVDSPEALRLVAQWSSAGHAVGNHSYAHRNFGSPQVSIQEFTADVERAHRLLSHVPTWLNRLRFPYLKEGDTADKRDGMRQWMDQNGYAHAYVSIDTSDWYYSDRLVRWRKQNPTADAQAFRAAYLQHLWDRSRYYEGLAVDVLGRRPAHVMLLHTNAINAAFLADVIGMFKERGWKIVSPAEAFADPMYTSRPATAPAGESIVWALSKQAGRADLRYPAEDAAYEELVLARTGF
jgi:peptidoglycan/xylan/chitin deacetylase (PgdA/CDA1 family)